LSNLAAPKTACSSKSAKTVKLFFYFFAHAQTKVSFVHQAMNITFSRPSYLARHLCHLSSKHGGQLLNEFFIYSEDITPSPGYLKGWRISKMTAVALRPKSLSRTRIQGI